MSSAWTIRESQDTDLAALAELYPAAFPEEDLLPLVKRLESEDIDLLSLVAVWDGDVIGHVAFTICTLGNDTTEVALLAPLCVAPSFQKQGVGSALVNEGHARMRARGISLSLVLGDPNYYGRFGYRPETWVQPPYPIPDEWADAWQSVTLREGFEPAPGVLNVPSAWKDPALWAA